MSNDDRTMLGYFLNMLAGAGNAMDLPGSSVRDVLAGRPAFDQWATPFGDQNRTTGRQLARDYGMVGNTDNWGNFLGGMAVETLSDPLSYAGVGLLTKGAKVKPAQAFKAMSRQAADPVGLAGDGMAQAGRHVGGVQNALTHNNYMATHNPPVGTWTEDLLNQYDSVHNMPVPDVAYNSPRLQFTPRQAMDRYMRIEDAGRFHQQNGLPPFARPDVERSAMSRVSDDLGEEFRDSAILYQHYPTPARPMYHQPKQTGTGILNKGGGGQHVVRKPRQPNPMRSLSDEAAMNKFDEMGLGHELDWHRNFDEDIDIRGRKMNMGEAYRKIMGMPSWFRPEHDDYDLNGLVNIYNNGIRQYHNARRAGPDNTFKRISKFNDQRLGRDINYGEF